MTTSRTTIPRRHDGPVRITHQVGKTTRKITAQPRQIPSVATTKAVRRTTNRIVLIADAYAGCVRDIAGFLLSVAVPAASSITSRTPEMTLTSGPGAQESSTSPPSPGCKSSACEALIIQLGPTSIGGQGSVSEGIEQMPSVLSINCFIAASVEKVPSAILSTDCSFTSPHHPTC